MKKLTFLLTLMLFVHASASANSQVTSLSGTGTSTDPYLVGTSDDLKFMRDSVNAGTAIYLTAFYKLTGNIDLAGNEWVPIGTVNPFKGGFDGNGKKITHLKIGTTVTPTSIGKAGLFANVTDAIIKNLSIEADGIYASGVTNAGILVGSATGTIISNCDVAGVISTTHTTNAYVGGIVGSCSGSKIMNCMADVNLIANSSGEGTLSSGGIAGNLLAGIFQGTASVPSVLYNSCSKNSVSATTVSATSFTGGVIGNLGAGNIYNCYSSASVKGECTSGAPHVFVGGIIGQGTAGLEVKNCIALNSSVICINPVGALNKIGRISGTYNVLVFDANYGLETMTLQAGTSLSALAVVDLGPKLVSNKQGEDLGSNAPKDLLNLYITSNTAPAGMSWMSWKVIDGVNNGNPVLYNPNTSIGSEIQTQSIKTYSSNGILTIEGLDLNKPISIYNINGQKVWTGFANADKTEIPLAKGVYALSGYKKLIMNY